MQAHVWRSPFLIALTVLGLNRSNTRWLTRTAGTSVQNRRYNSVWLVLRNLLGTPSAPVRLLQPSRSRGRGDSLVLLSQKSVMTLTVSLLTTTASLRCALQQQKPAQ
jgi:hypothetical protein